MGVVGVAHGQGLSCSKDGSGRVSYHPSLFTRVRVYVCASVPPCVCKREKKGKECACMCAERKRGGRGQGEGEGEEERKRRKRERECMCVRERRRVCVLHLGPVNSLSIM